MNAVDPNEVAEALCVEAEKLGLCHPTESMISSRMLDVVCNTLNFPLETAAHIPGSLDCTVMQMFHLLLELSGPLAEHAAHDLDHYGKNHRKWYAAVQRAQTFTNRAKLAMAAHKS